jgi:hypothetical protein
VHPRNVLDVGCAPRFRSLLIPPRRFQAADLSKSFNVGRRFDLVQSLEVAEHLPVGNAEEFVGCLCAHGDVVQFSAAQPGQGGVGHLNERCPSYWAGLFSAQADVAYDCVRILVILAPARAHIMLRNVGRNRGVGLQAYETASVDDRLTHSGPTNVVQ